MLKKKYEGITLISLVITIIIIVIIAGISFSMSGDNGIIARSQRASITQRLAEYSEELELYKK